MEYSKLSDFEINKRVAIANGLLVQEIDDSKATGMTSKYHELRPHTVWVSDDENPWEQYAPTLCWEDAGPIILNNRISLVWDCAEDASSEWWNAVDQFDECRVQYQSNPLRGAMIVFLMLLEQANVQDNPA
ncbi:TPA: DUF2591 family protein [Enterobacter hormaechei subsp. steigerwaltii]|nr:DUF2591 family protein [Enterobacter hormaechei subsp. steigerwaltii]